MSLNGLRVDQGLQNTFILRDLHNKKIIFIFSMTVDSENPLLIEVLTGSPTSYTHKPDTTITDYPHTIGKSTLLVR